MKKKERMKELIKWTSLAQTIHEIYTDLIEAKIENNNQKYEKSLYHLRLASDVENKICNEKWKNKYISPLCIADGLFLFSHNRLSFLKRWPCGAYHAPQPFSLILAIQPL